MASNNYPSNGQGNNIDPDDFMMKYPPQSTYPYCCCRCIVGPTGATGATGATVATGSGAIIPFASGLPVALTTINTGLAGLPAVVAFGNSSVFPNNLGATIDLTGVAGLAVNMSFSVPRDGVITDITAYFSIVLPLTLVGTTLTVRAQLYESAAPDNTFSPLAGTNLALSPSFSDTISIEDIAFATLSGLSIPISAGTRLLMVFSVTASRQ